MAGCGKQGAEPGQGGSAVTGSAGPRPGGLVPGKRGGTARAGWSNSNEGKLIAAAFLDAHSHLVEQVCLLQQKSLPPPVATKGSSKG